MAWPLEATLYTLSEACSAVLRAPTNQTKRHHGHAVERSSGARPHVRFQQGAAPTHSRVAPRRRAPPSASDRVTIADREQAGFAFGGTRDPSSPLYSARSGRTTILNFGYVVLALPSRRGTQTRVSSRRHPVAQRVMTGVRFSKNLGLVRGKVASRKDLSHRPCMSSIPAASTHVFTRRRSAPVRSTVRRCRT